MWKYRLCAFAALWVTQYAQAQQMSEQFQKEVAQNPNVLFLEAARQGNLQAAQQSLAQGASINITDGQGNTALILAISNQHVDLANYLLGQTDIDINIQNSKNMTALMIAALWGYPQIVKSLLDKGADMQPLAARDIKNTLNEVIKGANPEWLRIPNDLLGRLRLITIRKLYEDILRLLREYEEKLRNVVQKTLGASGTSGESETVVSNIVQGYLGVVDPTKQQELIDAISTGNVARVKNLLDAGVDVNARIGGKTPLIEAVRYIPQEEIEQTEESEQKAMSDQEVKQRQEILHPNYTIVTLLIDAGADVNAQDDKGVPVLVHLLREYDDNAFENEQNSGERRKLFERLFGQGRGVALDRIPELKESEIEAFFLYSKQDQEFLERMRILQLLLKKGLDLHALYRNHSLLSYAIQYQDFYAVKALLRMGAPVDIADVWNEAVLSNNTMLIKELLSSQDQSMLSAASKREMRALARHNSPQIAKFFSFIDAEFIKAAQDNNYQQVQTALRAGADPNFGDPEFNATTALMYVAGKGNIPLMALLFDYDADVNLQNTDGVTALMWAGLSNRVEAAEYLIERGAYPEIVDNTGRTFFSVANIYSAQSKAQRTVKNVAERLRKCKQLILAIEQNNDQEVLKILEEDPSLSTCNYGVVYPLGAAIYQDNLHNVQALLDAGAHPNLPWNNLIVAVLNNNTDIVEALLKAGVNIETQDHEGKTAREYALEQNNAGIINALQEYDIFKQELFDALETGSEKDIVQYIMAHDNYSLNVFEEKTGATPLGSALENEMFNVAPLLLERGAKINTVDRNGITLLMAMALAGKPKAVKWLLDKNVDLTHQDRWGNTVAAYAHKGNNPEVKTLIQKALAQHAHAATEAQTQQQLRVQQAQAQLKQQELTEKEEKDTKETGEVSANKRQRQE